jgi:hypothetical protein
LQRAYNERPRILRGMIGTLFRFLILRVLGGRAAAVLAIVGVILGWRGRRADGRVQGTDVDRPTYRVDDRTTVPPGGSGSTHV